MSEDSPDSPERKRALLLAWIEAAETTLDLLNSWDEQPPDEAPGEGREKSVSGEEPDEMLSDEEKRAFSLHVLKTLEEHRDEFADVEFDGKTVDETIAMLRAKKEETEQAAEEVDAAAGVFYEAAANVAEAKTSLIADLARLMRSFAALSEEQLDDMGFEDRMRIVELVGRWRNGEGEKWLSQLPIELRREVE
jgi:hypothetical protein